MDSRQSAGLAIARVEGGGTAFAISRELALTAWHVVRSALQPVSGPATVRLKFATGDLIEATLERHDADADVAVLRLHPPGLPPDLEVLPISTVVRYRQEWRAHGYPEAVSGRSTIDGAVTDPAARLKGSASAIQLGCRQAAASSPLPMRGFSGSPVIDQDFNMVIGLVRLEFRHPERPGAVGGSVWATSLADVARLWPDLVGPLVQLRRTELRAGLGELLLHGLSLSGELPQARDFDAHAVGATLTRYSRQDNAPYVRRPQADTELVNLLRHQRAILVVGPSGAGKSRTAFQAVRMSMPQAGFAHPRPTRQAVRRLMQLDREQPLCAGPLVLWLDELDAYLNDEESISPAVVDWILERDGGGVIVATMRDDQYAELRESVFKAAKGVRLFLDRFEEGYFFLGHRISRDEAALASRLYPGQDFSDLQLGIGLKLVSGPELIARLRRAQAANPQGWAVVKAAVDYIWMGLSPPIPGKILRQLFDVSLGEASPQIRPDDNAYRQGVAWACERAASGVALLSTVRSSGRGRPEDAFELVDQAEEFGLQHRWQVFAGSWQVALATASAADLLMVGSAARMRDEPEVAVSALRAAAGQGSATAALELGLMLARDGEVAQARRWIGQAVKAGHPGAPAAMGLMLAQAGHFDEAREWLWRGIEAGATEAAFFMSQLAARQERDEEAVYWATIAAQEGESEAWIALAQIYYRLGDERAATDCLDEGAATSGVTAALCKSELAAKAGDGQAAGEWLQAAAELGDAHAACMLGRMLAEEDRISEAEHWLRRAARSDPIAVHDLGVLYEITGDIPAARDYYERAHKRKSEISAAALARLSLTEGDVTGAAAWLRAEADAVATDPEDFCPVAFDLAQALRRQGRNTEAAAWLEESAEAGYVPAMVLLGRIAMNARDTQAAEDWLMRAAGGGDHEAAGLLGEVLEDKGELTRAACWLKAAAEAERDSGAPGTAAEGLARVNASLEAERRRQPDPEADRWLAQGIAAQERGDDKDAGFRFAMAAGRGNAEAAFRRARILLAADDKSGAVQSYRMAAERGHALAATALSFLAPDPLEHGYWLQVACSAGEPIALRALGQARLEANDAGGAEALFRQLAESGDLTAAGVLGALLLSHGEPEEGCEWLTKALDEEDATIAAIAAHNLGMDALTRGDRADAMSWFQRAVAADWTHSMLPLARILREDGASEQADTLLRRAFENGDLQSAAELAFARYKSGDLGGALEWAAAAAERGNVGAAYLAGRLSYDAGNREDAEKWFRMAADSGEAEAAVRLAALVARRGDLRAAEVVLVSAVSQGNAHALYAVGDLAWRRGWMSAAEAYFAAAADAGHLFAALDAAALADLRKDPEAKTYWLEQWRSGGTTSSLVLRSARNFYDIGLTIFRNAPWEPGQPVTYGVSTPVLQTSINCESGLELRLDQSG